MPNTFEKLVAELRPAYEAKGLSELREIVSATDAKMEAVASAIGPEADIMRADTLSGDTASERMEAFTKLHADNSAAKDVLVSKEKLLAISNEITARNAGGGPTNTQADKAESQLVPGRNLAGPGGPLNPFGDPQGIGDIIMSSPKFPGFSDPFKVELDDVGLRDVLNATFKSTAGWPPESTRTGYMEYAILRELNILDFVPMLTTEQQLFKYVEEGAVTNSAAERAEEAEIAEQTLTVSEKSVEPRSIAVQIPVTQEQLEDEMGTRQYLNMRLGYLVRRRVEDQIINGNGTAPNIRGYLQTTGINTVTRAATATTNTAETYHEAQITTRVESEMQPDAYLIHPTHWGLLVRQTDKDKQWLYGMPGDPMMVPRLWGLPVILNTGMPQTTTGTGSALTNGNVALVGGFMGHSACISRRGLVIEMSNSHGTDFTHLRVRFRAYVRATLAVFRPKAFTKIAGVNYGRTDS